MTKKWSAPWKKEQSMIYILLLWIVGLGILGFNSYVVLSNWSEISCGVRGGHLVCSNFSLLRPTEARLFFECHDWKCSMNDSEPIFNHPYWIAQQRGVIWNES